MVVLDMASMRSHARGGTRTLSIVADALEAIATLTSEVIDAARRPTYGCDCRDKTGASITKDIA
jgi:hypothetical protein